MAEGVLQLQHSRGDADVGTASPNSFGSSSGSKPLYRHGSSAGFFRGLTKAVVLLFCSPSSSILCSSSSRSGAVFSSVAAAFSEKKPMHPQSSPPAPSRLKAGFVGCGTIASAIATGLMTQKQIQVESVAVTKRSREKSAALQEAFPELVHVHDSGQDVVDQSDVVFVCVLPQQTSQVLRGLKFDQERHTLVSLVVRVAIRLLAAVVAFPTNLSDLIFSSNTRLLQSTAKLDDLVRDSRLNPSEVSKLICLPSVARHEGVALLCCAPSDSSLDKDAAAPACQGRNDNGLTPATKTVESIFQAMGGVVTLQSETEFEACMVTTAIMGPLYGIMREGRDWLLRQTSLSQQEASYLIVKQYVGAIQDAGFKVGDDQLSLDSGHLLDELIKEQTQGGLNEQALHNLDKLQGLDAQRRIMDALLARLRGESDGFI